MWVKWYLMVVLICISLVISVAEGIFLNWALFQGNRKASKIISKQTSSHTLCDRDAQVGSYPSSVPKMNSFFLEKQKQMTVFPAYTWAGPRMQMELVQGTWTHKFSCQGGWMAAAKALLTLDTPEAQSLHLHRTQLC